jgi:hypothetical protein
VVPTNIEDELATSEWKQDLPGIHMQHKAEDDSDEEKDAPANGTDRISPNFLGIKLPGNVYLPWNFVSVLKHECEVASNTTGNKW